MREEASEQRASQLGEAQVEQELGRVLMNVRADVTRAGRRRGGGRREEGAGKSLRGKLGLGVCKR